MTTPPPQVDPLLFDEIRLELERIVASRWLKESQQLSRMLRHIVDETLAGRGDGLKEYNLGLAVFHRSSDYDPRSDAIVRVQASQLRRKLLSYYDNEGRDAGLKIELPRGGYVPAFTPVPRTELVLAPEPALPAALPVLTMRQGRPWRAFAAGAAAMALVCAVAAGLMWWWPRGDGPDAKGAVWSAFFAPGTETLVSFGSPLFFTGGVGIYVRDVQMNTQGQPHSETLRTIEERLGISLNPQNDVYTGIGEMLGVMEVSRWLERRKVRVELANSHYLGKSELQGKNLVVVSSVRFQTLLNDLKPPAEFPFLPDRGGRLVNLRPLPGEPHEYEPSEGGGLDQSYAVLSVWPGTVAGRRILGLSGINTWSTQAAVQYALNAQQMANLQRRLDADPAQGPRGKKGPFFQVILRAEGKHNQLWSVNYVTHRYLAAPDVLPW